MPIRSHGKICEHGLQVPSRGASLNGSSLPAQGRHASDDVTPHAHGNGAQSASRGYRPTAELQASPWLAFKGRWGSSVEAPAMQEWFYRAENPVTRTWLQQVCALVHRHSAILVVHAIAPAGVISGCMYAGRTYPGGICLPHIQLIPACVRMQLMHGC